MLAIARDRNPNELTPRAGKFRVHQLQPQPDLRPTQCHLFSSLLMSGGGEQQPPAHMSPA